MKNIFILCRIGQLFIYPYRSKGKNAANKANTKSSSSQCKFFLQEDRVKDKA
jgi:hypothetical protein